MIAASDFPVRLRGFDGPERATRRASTESPPPVGRPSKAVVNSESTADGAVLGWRPTIRRALRWTSSAAFLGSLVWTPAVEADGFTPRTAGDTPQQVGSRSASPDASTAGGEDVAGPESTDHLADDPCAVGERDHWIEWMDAQITRSVCSTSRWFDNLFGDGPSTADRDATFGRIGIGARWDEDDGLEDDFRFRAKYHLPNLERRVNVLVGGGGKVDLDDEEGFGSSATKDLFFADDNEWLLGFGINRLKSRNRRLSLDAGVKFSSGLDPYVRLGVKRYWTMSENMRFRARLTPQWQSSRGVGASSSLTLERLLKRNLLLRCEVRGQAFEQWFEGIAFFGEAALYHHLGRGRAMRYGITASGETGKDVPVEDEGLQVTYRQSVYKEILFVETFAGATWRRRVLEDEREPKAILGLVFELKFGR
jgi:hypothetical protein